MSTGKLLIGAVALGAIAVGGWKLLGNSGGSGDGDATATDTGTTASQTTQNQNQNQSQDDGGNTGGDRLWSVIRDPSSSTFPVLTIGEDDLVIDQAFLDELDSGLLWANTGTTGKTLGDFGRPDPAAVQDISGVKWAERSVAAELTAQARETGPGSDYSEKQLDDVWIGRFDDGGIETERPLGSVLFRFLDLDESLAAVNVAGGIAMLGESNPLVVINHRAFDPPSASGEIRIEGRTELNAAIGSLRDLHAAGRVQAGDGPDSVSISGVTLTVFAPAGSDEPFVLEPTGVHGMFWVRRPDQAPLGRPLIELIQSDAMMPGEVIDVVLETAAR